MDRDGTLILERGYLRDPDQVELYEGVIESLQLLRDSGYLLFVVTNQSGVGRGFFTMVEVENVHARLLQILDSEEIHISKFYVAPESPGEPGFGRKPSPQFLIDAANEFGLDLAQCFMIGDKLSDIECGINAGVAHNFLVETGHGIKESQRLASDSHQHTTTVPNLRSAATSIVRFNFPI